MNTNENTNKILVHLSIVTMCSVLFTMSAFAQTRVNNYRGLKIYEPYQSVEPNDHDYDDSWHLERIEANKAWEITKGFSSILVNVCDTGINYNKPSLTGFTDLNGNVDISNSIDLSSDNDPLYDYYSPNSDLKGHGTRVSCALGAKGDNYEGSCGVSWDVTMISIKCSGTGMNDTLSFTALSSIFDLNSNNYRGFAPITNMSIAVPYNSECDDLYSRIQTYNGLVVASAGQYSKNIDSPNNAYYPASFDLDNIIVVGGSDENDEVALYNNGKYSNTGANSVDLFAPSVGIKTAQFSAQQTYVPYYLGVDDFQGTSAAAPLVAGTAALMLSVNPNLENTDLKTLIMDNVDHVSSLTNYCSSGGRLNTYKAVKAAIPQITTFNSFVNGIQPLPAGKHQFYKLILPPGTYTFETSGNLYTSGYLYIDIQYAPIAYSTNQSGNFSFTFSTIKNQAVYLKVVNNSLTSGSYSVKVSSNHTTHTYNDHYSWYDGYYHKAYCSCGLYQLKPHICQNGDLQHCIFCNGPYTGPMNNPLSNPIIVGNDSRILANGTIILGNIDYNLYLSGELDLDSLIGGETI